MFNQLISKMIFRVFKNPKTSIAGGVVGVAGAALVGELERQSGCHFAEAFMGVDWVQVLVFVLTQVFGAFVTDGSKKVGE